MAFFNEFKKKFNEAAQSVTSKTKEGVEITRLSSESRGINTEIITLHEKIGRIYVESKGTDYETLASLCARVEELKQRLEELNRQKAQIKQNHQKIFTKNQTCCPACGAGMNKDARFCSNCGQRMSEIKAETASAPETAEATHSTEAPEVKEEPYIITRPIFVRQNNDSDEAPTDYEEE